MALHLAAPYTISDISDMPDAPVHDAGPPLIEAFVWLGSSLGLFSFTDLGRGSFGGYCQGKGF